MSSGILMLNSERYPFYTTLTSIDDVFVLTLLTFFKSQHTTYNINYVYALQEMKILVVIKILLLLKCQKTAMNAEFMVFLVIKL